jgi:sulfide:quinone oxidoreductase
MQGELDVVIAGGSFAGLETMLALRAVAEERVSVELWARDPEFLYRPLAAASPFGVSLVHRFPLGAIAERCGARYIRAGLAAVDARAREVRTTQREPRSYDALVVACGARAVEAVPGALTFRGAPDVEGFRELLERVQSGTVHRLTFVVPAGVSWPLPLYELALMTARHMGVAAPAEITLVTPERAPLGVFGVSASNLVRDLLDEQGIRLATDRHAVRYADGASSCSAARRCRSMP